MKNAKPALAEFAPNLHVAGSASLNQDALPGKSAMTPVRAGQGSWALNLAGVDILRFQSMGPVVMEVNSSPGLEGIEFDTGAANKPGLIIEHRRRTVRRISPHQGAKGLAATACNCKLAKPASCQALNDAG